MENKKTTIEEQFDYLRNEVLEQIESIDIEKGRTWGVSWVLDDRFDNMIRLVELYELSKEAREFLSENQEIDFKERYQELIKSYIWSRARKILLEIGLRLDGEETFFGESYNCPKEFIEDLCERVNTVYSTAMCEDNKTN